MGDMGLFESTWATCRTYKQNAVPCDKDAPAHCVRSLKGTLEARFVRCEMRLFRVECLQYIIVGLVLLNLGLMFLSDEQKIHMQDKIPAINPFQVLDLPWHWNALSICSSSPWVSGCTIR